MFQKIRNYKEKYCTAGNSNRQQTKSTHHKCLRCLYVDHFITKFPEPSKYNKKQQNHIRFNEKSNRKSQR